MQASLDKEVSSSTSAIETQPSDPTLNPTTTIPPSSTSTSLNSSSSKHWDLPPVQDAASQFSFRPAPRQPQPQIKPRPPKTQSDSQAQEGFRITDEKHYPPENEISMDVAKTTTAGNGIEQADKQPPQPGSERRIDHEAKENRMTVNSDEEREGEGEGDDETSDEETDGESAPSQEPPSAAQPRLRDSVGQPTSTSGFVNSFRNNLSGPPHSSNALRQAFGTNASFQPPPRRVPSSADSPSRPLANDMLRRQLRQTLSSSSSRPTIQTAPRAVRPTPTSASPFNGRRTRSESQEADESPALKRIRQNATTPGTASPRANDLNGAILGIGRIGSAVTTGIRGNPLEEMFSSLSGLQITLQKKDHEIDRLTSLVSSIKLEKESLKTQTLATVRKALTSGDEARLQMEKVRDGMKETIHSFLNGVGNGSDAKKLKEELDELKQVFDVKFTSENGIFGNLEKSEASKVQVLRQLQLELSNRQDVIDLLREQLETKIGEISEARERISSLEMSLLNDSKGFAMHEKLEETCREAEERKKKLEKMVGEWNERSLVVAAELELARQECGSKEKEKAELEIKLSRVIAELQIASTANKELSRNFEEANRLKASLTVSLETSEAKHIEALADAKQDHVRTLETALGSLKEQHARELFLQTSEKARLLSSLEHAQCELDKLSGRMDEITEMKNSMTQMSESIKIQGNVQVVALEKEVARLRDQLESKIAGIAATEATNKGLQATITQLQTQMIQDQKKDDDCQRQALTDSEEASRRHQAQLKEALRSRDDSAAHSRVMLEDTKQRHQQQLETAISSEADQAERLKSLAQELSSANATIGSLEQANSKLTLQVASLETHASVTPSESNKEARALEIQQAVIQGVRRAEDAHQKTLAAKSNELKRTKNLLDEANKKLNSAVAQLQKAKSSALPAPQALGPPAAPVPQRAPENVVQTASKAMISRPARQKTLTAIDEDESDLSEPEDMYDVTSLTSGAGANGGTTDTGNEEETKSTGAVKSPKAATESPPLGRANRRGRTSTSNKTVKANDEDVIIDDESPARPKARRATKVDAKKKR